jgi:hypothetical protein
MLLEMFSGIDGILQGHHGKIVELDYRPTINSISYLSKVIELVLKHNEYKKILECQIQISFNW